MRGRSRLRAAAGGVSARDRASLRDARTPARDLRDEPHALREEDEGLGALVPGRGGGDELLEEGKAKVAHHELRNSATLKSQTM